MLRPLIGLCGLGPPSIDRLSPLEVLPHLLSLRYASQRGESLPLKLSCRWTHGLNSNACYRRMDERFEWNADLPLASR
jgi:hypothetical protein